MLTRYAIIIELLKTRLVVKGTGPAKLIITAPIEIDVVARSKDPLVLNSARGPLVLEHHQSSAIESSIVFNKQSSPGTRAY